MEGRRKGCNGGPKRSCRLCRVFRDGGQEQGERVASRRRGRLVRGCARGGECVGASKAALSAGRVSESLASTGWAGRGSTRLGLVSVCPSRREQLRGHTGGASVSTRAGAAHLLSPRQPRCRSMAGPRPPTRPPSPACCTLRAHVLGTRRRVATREAGAMGEAAGGGGGGPLLLLACGLHGWLTWSCACPPACSQPAQSERASLLDHCWSAFFHCIWGIDPHTR